MFKNNSWDVLLAVFAGIAGAVAVLSLEAAVLILMLEEETITTAGWFGIVGLVGGVIFINIAIALAIYDDVR